MKVMCVDLCRLPLLIARNFVVPDIRLANCYLSYGSINVCSQICKY